MIDETQRRRANEKKIKIKKNWQGSRVISNEQANLKLNQVKKKKKKRVEMEVERDDECQSTTIKSIDQQDNRGVKIPELSDDHDRVL